MVPKGGHFVIGAIFLSIGASAFTGSRSTPTCPRRMLLPPPVQSGATSTASMIRHDEGQKYTNSYYAGEKWGLGHLGGGASCRAWSPTFRSRNYRSTALLAAPRVSDEEMEQRKEQLRELLCATEAEIDKLVAQNPCVLQYSDVVKSHAPKVALLQERLGIGQKEAGKVYLAAARILSSSLETLENKMNWLQDRLNLNKSQLRTILERDPEVLGLSVENNIEPTLNNIQSGLELSDEELTKLTVRTPDLLKNFSEEAEAIIPRIQLLQKILFLGEGDFATVRKKVIIRPELLFWAEDRMLEVQKWMKDRFDFGDATIGKLCRNMPQLLIANIETLDERAKEIQEELRRISGRQGVEQSDIIGT